MAQPDIRVTIGITTYNRASLLREAIQSALSQSYDNFEVLICDNASQDETQDVVASFDDARIRYARSDTNLGMIPNFNRVIELADGDAVVLLSDDDVLYPAYLSSVVPVLSSHPSVGSRTYRARPDRFRVAHSQAWSQIARTEGAGYRRTRRAVPRAEHGFALDCRLVFGALSN